MANFPSIYRISIEVGDLDQAVAFYATLLGNPGLKIRGGGRHYFECGPIILALVNVGAADQKPKPLSQPIYLSTGDLEGVHRRAEKLGCLGSELVHGFKSGDINTYPWGERSFYALDPWGNPLCFADDKTLFTGK